MKLSNPAKVIIAIVFSELAGVIGSVFTFSSLTDWYAALIKPSFTPPSWVFTPVWFILYFLMGVALYMVWTTKGKHKEKQLALEAFGLQYVLNIAWPLVFFGMRSPVLGLATIVALAISIIGTMFYFRKVSRNSIYPLVPYLAWVSFAALLNYSIVVLNS